MDKFVGATVVEYAGQPRGTCPGFARKFLPCKQWCLQVEGFSIACCGNHRDQRDVESANGVLGFLHRNCGVCKSEVVAAQYVEIDLFSGEATHQEACATRWSGWAWTSARPPPRSPSSPSRTRCTRTRTKQGQPIGCNLTYGQMPAPLIGASL